MYIKQGQYPWKENSKVAVSIDAALWAMALLVPREDLRAIKMSSWLRHSGSVTWFSKQR